MRRNRKFFLLSTLTIFAFFGVGMVSGWFSGKSVWDWLDLLIVPSVIGLSVAYFESMGRLTELEIAERNNEVEREISKERYWESTFKEFLDKMTVFVIENGLLKAQANADLTNIAIMRTRTTLRILNAKWKQEVVVFLSESGITKSIPGILCNCDLSKTDLNRIGLSNADLSDAQLNDAILSGANLNASELSRASIVGAKLIGTQMQAATLTSADLTNSDLQGASLSRSKLTAAKFKNAKLKATKMVGCVATNTIFKAADSCGSDRTDLSGSDFSNANMSEASFRNIDMHKCKLAHVDCSGTDFSGANFFEVTFTECSCEKARWVDANLSAVEATQSSFNCAILSNAKFHRAVITHCQFENGDLSGCDFEGAVLHQIDLNGANICGADFSKVKGIYGTNFAVAKYDATTKWPAGFNPASMRDFSLPKGKGTNAVIPLPDTQKKEQDNRRTLTCNGCGTTEKTSYVGDVHGFVCYRCSDKNADPRDANNFRPIGSGGTPLDQFMSAVRKLKLTLIEPELQREVVRIVFQESMSLCSKEYVTVTQLKQAVKERISKEFADKQLSNTKVNGILRVFLVAGAFERISDTNNTQLLRLKDRFLGANAFVELHDALFQVIAKKWEADEYLPELLNGKGAPPLVIDGEIVQIAAKGVKEQEGKVLANANSEREEEAIH